MSGRSQKALFRRLTLSLYISGAFNIVLITSAIYWIFQESPPALFCDLKPVEVKTALTADATNAQVVSHYKTLSRDQLIAKLSQKTLLEDGFSERDLALGCLVTLHHFHLFKALTEPSPYIQTRILTCGENHDKILTYPGLSEKQFERIIRYAATEKWPLTSRGLFLLLKAQKDVRDPTLADAFYLTTEFLNMETLFNRSEITLEKEELLNFLVEGEWKTVAEFSAKQKLEQDLSMDARRRLLFEYIQQGSQKAAKILLKLDFDYVVKKMDDKSLIGLLKLLTEKFDLSAKLAQLLLNSPRSDTVRDMASDKLAAYGESTFHLKKAAEYLLTKEQKKPEDVPKATHLPAKITPVLKAAPLKAKTYIVQEGDSLWKISRKFRVDIDALKACNRLSSDCLQPGTVLKVP